MTGRSIAPASTTAVASRQPFGSRGPAAPGEFFPSVMAAFATFTAALEGRLNYAYQDNRGLVTTAAGYLIDPISYALPPTIPWQIEGRAATVGEVTEQWKLIKSNIDTGLMSVGAGKIPGNTMRLTYDAVDTLTASKARTMTFTLASLFFNVLDWPADAQLGLLGVAWGTGPNLRDPGASYMAPFVSAVDAANFLDMAQTAHWGNINNDRKMQLQLLFTNADYVIEQSGDKSALNWPVRVSATVLAVGGQAPAPLPPSPAPPPWPK